MSDHEAKPKADGAESLSTAGLGGCAKARFYKLGGDEEPDPLERLRFFCSLAMDGQDWIDVEPFFDDVKACMTPNVQSQRDAQDLLRGSAGLPSSAAQVSEKG
jgi:hypothetical protein